MWNHDSRARSQLRAAVALVLAFWVVMIGGQLALAATDAPAAHPHAVAASSHTHPVVLEHPHLQSGSSASLLDNFLEAVVPRATTVAAALGLALAISAVAAFWRGTSLAAVRGPPRPVAAVVTGRLTLTRLCIARS